MTPPVEDPRLRARLEAGEEFSAEESAQLLAELEGGAAAQELDELLQDLRALAGPELEPPEVSEAEWAARFSAIQAATAEAMPSLPQEAPHAPLAGPAGGLGGILMALLASLVVAFSLSQVGAPPPARSSGAASTPGGEPTIREPGPKSPGIDGPGTLEPGVTEPGDTEPGDTEPGDTEPGIIEARYDPLDDWPTFEEELDQDLEPDVLIDLEPGSGYLTYPRSTGLDSAGITTVLWIESRPDDAR